MSRASPTAETSSSLLYRLHTNEEQLRMLAVVLSLTGGLVLSLALGVGIFVYWHCREYKRRRRRHATMTTITTVLSATKELSDTIPFDHSETEVQPLSPPGRAYLHSPSSSSPQSSLTPLSPSTLPLCLSPPINEDEQDTPEPSAPLAKEVLMAASIQSHMPERALASSSSDPCIHRSPGPTRTCRTECHLCCDHPPPAYSPPSSRRNTSFIDPD